MHFAVIGFPILSLIVNREYSVGIIQSPPPFTTFLAEAIRISILGTLVGSGSELHKVMMEYCIVNIEYSGYGCME